MNGVGRFDLVVVGAHPLDAEILGGAIAAGFTAAGGRAMLVHVTDGSGNYPDLGPDGSSRQARMEAARAARVLGSDMCWLGFPSALLHSGGQFLATLAGHFRAWQPSLIITHWRGSWHERHRITYRLVRRAVASTALTPAVYFGENFEDLDGFRPTHYVDTTDVCARWWQALEAYRLVAATRDIDPHDLVSFPYDSYYHAAPRVRGLECGLPLAHALQKQGSSSRRQVVDTVSFLHSAIP